MAGYSVDSKRYDAFGLPVSITNPSGSQQGFASAFGYQEDAETGLRLLGHRYYDSATGRFVTRDPAQDGRNWFVYVDNNPLKAVDADGLKRIIIVKGAMGSNNPEDDPDISGYADHIIEGIKDSNPGDEVIVVDSAEDAYRVLGQNPQTSDALVWIGHADCTASNGNGLYCSGEPFDPFQVSAARGGVRLPSIKLIGCHTLTNAVYAAAWARLVRRHRRDARRQSMTFDNHFFGDYRTISWKPENVKGKLRIPSQAPASALVARPRGRLTKFLPESVGDGRESEVDTRIPI